MIADFFTKPLEGKLFIWLRDIVIGLAPFPMEERVGLHKNDVKMTIAEECSATSREQEPLNKNKVSWVDIVKRQK